MGCSHQVRRADGELYCEPKNRRCVEVPGSECRELYDQQKEAQKDERSTE